MEAVSMSRDIKKKNRSLVFRYLMHEENFTKKSVANALNMSMPTLMRNLKELEDMNLIVKSGQDDSSGGRKAEIFSINTRAKIAIGVDITRNHIAVAAVDLGVKVLAHRREHYPFENTDAYFQQLGDFIHSFIAETGYPDEDIIGIGVSIPGILSQDQNKLLYGDVIDFNGQSLDKFSKALNSNCRFSNDSSAAGYAEFMSEPQLKNAVYLYLSNSVGGSIMINGETHPGSNNKSAEFGHMCIVPDGKECYCGHKGCMNAYCNATILASAVGGTVDDFFEKLSAGDTHCREVWEEYKKHLIYVIRSLRVIFDAHVIIGGYVGSCMGPYFEEIRQELQEDQLFESGVDYVSTCKYKVEAAAVGAALIFIQEYINGI